MSPRSSPDTDSARVKPPATSATLRCSCGVPSSRPRENGLVASGQSARPWLLLRPLHGTHTQRGGCQPCIFPAGGPSRVQPGAPHAHLVGPPPTCGCPPALLHVSESLEWPSRALCQLLSCFSGNCCHLRPLCDGPRGLSGPVSRGAAGLSTRWGPLRAPSIYLTMCAHEQDCQRLALGHSRPSAWPSSPGPACSPAAESPRN